MQCLTEYLGMVRRLHWFGGDIVGLLVGAGVAHVLLQVVLCTFGVSGFQGLGDTCPGGH